MDLLDNFVIMIMFGSIYGIFIWSITGLLGGFTMALIVKSLLKSISKSGFWAIVIGWFIGIVAGFTISYMAIAFIASTPVESNYLLVVITTVGGLIAGGIGSGIMYGAIDRELVG